MNDEKRPSGEDPTQWDDATREDATRTAGGADTAGDTSLPTSIGRYRILGKLGEGGMGVVYEAEQESPRRRVAVKVVRGGQFVDEQRVRMFQREADTLARLKHPNIAGIYESGCTEDGRHFFAMELVQGEKLDAYIKARPSVSSTDELRFRLALFRKIADAVHYAHQRGVIHRDLKPSNILVSREVSTDDSSASTVTGFHLPEIKILDFGLARITEGDVAAATMTTEIGVIKGTLPYMSPEQARGNPEDIDIRTDVYALGVILYEMLTGQRPYDVLRKTLMEAVRVICEEPAAPLSSSGIRKVDSDIETIVGKALEKETQRRYASAAALSEDVNRWLTSQPILARPPSAVYQARKFAERNRTLVGGIAATVLMLILGAVASTIFGLQAQAARRVAEANLDRAVEAEEQATREAETATQVSDFMAELFQVVSPSEARGKTITAKEILDRGAQRIGRELEDEPLIQARLQRVMGGAYRDLGLFDDAEPLLDQALATHEELLGSDDAEVATDLCSLGRLYWYRFKIQQMAKAIERCLEIRREALDPEDPDLAEPLVGMAAVMMQTGRVIPAEPYLREALQIQEKALDADDLDTAQTLHTLGVWAGHRAEYKQAIGYLERAVRIYEANGPDHPEMAQTLRRFGRILTRAGRLEEAKRYARMAVDLAARTLGADHLETAFAMEQLALVLLDLEEYAEAQELLRRVVEIREGHVLQGQAMWWLVLVECRQGHREEARRLLGEMDWIPDDQPWERDRTLGDLYSCLRDPEAVEYYARAVEAMVEPVGPEHFHTIRTRRRLADEYFRFGDYEGAAAQRSAALEAATSKWGETHFETLRLGTELGLAYARLDLLDEAASLLEDVVEKLRAERGREDYLTLMATAVLGDVYRRLGRYDEAGVLLREVLDAQVESLGEEAAEVAMTRFRVACLAAATGQRELAMEELRKAVDHGWADRGIFEDSALDTLRGDPELEALVSEVEERLKILG